MKQEEQAVPAEYAAADIGIRWPCGNLRMDLGAGNVLEVYSFLSVLPEADISMRYVS